MTYRITYKGMVVKEFDTAGEMDQYLADRVFEWVDLSPEHTAHLGADYLEMVNDRGTRVTLSFTPVKRPDSLVSDNSLIEGDTVKRLFN